MSDPDIPNDIVPYDIVPYDIVLVATPSDAEIAAWRQLPRDEQVRRVRAALAHPDCKVAGTATMDELRQRGRDLAAKIRNG